MSNAGKFTSNGQVTLGVSRYNEQNNSLEWLKFEVIDTGIGIALQELEELFQPFSQVKTTVVSSNEGTGLGLAISKRLCSIMGGEIKVISEQGNGTTFIVLIPTELKKTTIPLQPNSKTKRVA